MLDGLVRIRLTEREWRDRWMHVIDNDHPVSPALLLAHLPCPVLTLAHSHPLPILNISEHYTRTKLQYPSSEYKSLSLSIFRLSTGPILIFLSFSFPQSSALS